jgi:hypothetical protein
MLPGDEEKEHRVVQNAAGPTAESFSAVVGTVMFLETKLCCNCNIIP